jgi:enediyne biosynthesis protein CalE5
MSSNREKNVLKEWEESAPYWAKHADIVRRMFAPITTALINAAEIREGYRILDVAGGLGEPSLNLSSLAGLSGLVVCTDAIAEMVGTARREALQRTLTNIEFAQCVAEAVPFFDGSFDAVVCRLGIMLFPDPAGALQEILRVLKRGGQVSCAVWGKQASNPFFAVVADVVSRFVESPREDPDAPGAFRFAEPQKLTSLLSEAGAIEVRAQIVDFVLEAPITPKQFHDVRVELSDTLREKLAPLSQEQKARIAQQVEEAGRAFFEGGKMRFPSQVLIVTGRKA